MDLIGTKSSGLIESVLGTLRKVLDHFRTLFLGLNETQTDLQTQQKSAGQ